MRCLFKLLVLILLFAIAINTCAQQLPLYTQYMMNFYLINPAIAGHDGLSSVNFLAREQWLGFEKAPRTVAITGQTRLLRNSPISRNFTPQNKPVKMSRSGNVGLGASIYNDRNGIMQRTGVGFTYAYHIWMDQNQLSFGTSLTAFQLKIDRTNEVLHNHDDPLLLNMSGALFVPDINFGVYWSNPNYYIGLSSLQMIESAVKFGNDGFKEYKTLRHYYLMSGYGIHYNKWLFEPSLLLQTNLLDKPMIDINTRVYYQDDWWGGVSYRSNRAFIFMMGVKIQNDVYIGYSFDYNLTSIRKHSMGSHEFMVSIKFGDTAKRYRWLNRY